MHQSHEQASIHTKKLNLNEAAQTPDLCELIAFCDYPIIENALKIKLGILEPKIEKYITNTFRLQAFADTVTECLKGSSSIRLKSQNRSAPVIDLRESKQEIIVVGDLHGRIDNLNALLKHDSNWEKVVNNKAKLIFLGDLVHPEQYPFDDMKTSIILLNWFMQLKIICPEGVDWIVGNHDPIFENTYKGGVNQSEVFRSALKSSYSIDADYPVNREFFINGEFDRRSSQAINILSNVLIQHGALIALAPKHILCHAAPPEGHFISTEDLTCLSSIKDVAAKHLLNSNDPQGIAQVKARWARWNPDKKEGEHTNYGPTTVTRWKDFEVEAGEKNTLIFGHNPQQSKEGGREWNKSFWKLGKDQTEHYILVSCHPIPTYASITAGKLTIKQVI